jgi:hypothetical protein
LARQAATRRGSALSPKPDQMRSSSSSKGRERKVIRAKDTATDADPATEDPRSPGHATNRHCLAPGAPQGMPLTGIAPWGQRPLRPSGGCTPVRRWLVGVGGRLVGAGAVSWGGALRLAAHVLHRDAVRRCGA